MPRAPRLDLEALRARVGSAGFTPSVRDLPGLVALLAEGGVGPAGDEGESDPKSDAADRAAEVTRALVRVGLPLLEPLGSVLPEAPPRARPHLCRVVGRLAQLDPERAVGVLVPRLADSDPRTRRAAAVALGKIDRPEVEPALLAAWERETELPERRALAEALGKVGGASALAALAAARTDDAELGRLSGRARLLIERTQGRGEESAVVGDALPPAPVEILFGCRIGIEPMLVDELDELDEHGSGWDARRSGPGEVRATLRGSLASALLARSAVDVGVLLPVEPIHPGGSAEDAVVRALVSETARTLLTTWTRGVVRYRLAWADGGHRRAAVFRIAERVRREAPELVNDPKASPWELRVIDRGSGVEIAMCPKGLPDTRFDYRVRDVPAASHPTVAAALARVGGVREDDVVWDPFVGSGSELVERARAGKVRALVGTDLDPKALDAARANLAAAGVTATLVRRDALLGFPDRPGAEAIGPPTLIVTNPPLGHRLYRAGGAPDLLERFVEVAARELAPRGRLVWITSAPDRTTPRARRAGLVRRLEQPIDLAAPRRADRGARRGGLSAVLEVWEKPAAAGAKRGELR